MIAAAMLALIADAGEGVLVLADDLDEAQLLRSRLTRAEVQRQLLQMAETLAALPAPLQAVMPEIDWAGWRATGLGLQGERAMQDAVLWFGVRSLVPATLAWLRVYRQSMPERFAFTA
jgi:uncharacterized protein with HEPN domain